MLPSVLHRHPVDQHPARRGLLQPGHHPRKGGLPGPVGTGEQHGRARLEVQVQPAEDLVVPGRPGVVGVPDIDQADLGAADGAAGAGRGSQLGGHRRMPGVQRDLPVGDGRFVGVVGDLEDGGLTAVGERPEDPVDRRATLLVDHRRGFVTDEHSRMSGQRRRYRKTLQLTTRQRPGLAVQHAAQTDLIEQCLHLGFGESGIAPRQVIGHHHAQHLGLGPLTDHRGATRTTQSDRPRPADGACGGITSGDHFRESRLADPIGPRHRHQFPGREGHRHISDDRLCCTRVGDGDVVQTHRQGADGAGVGTSFVGVRCAQSGDHRRDRPAMKEEHGQCGERDPRNSGRGYRDPPVVETPVDRRVDHGRELVEARVVHQSLGAPPPVVDLFDHELAVIGEQSQETGRDSRRRHRDREQCGEGDPGSVPATT